MNQQLWVQRFRRKNERGSSQARVEELGEPDELAIPPNITDLAELRRHIFGIDNYKNTFQGLDIDQLYFYKDAGCKKRLKPDALIPTDTSCDKPIRLVLPTVRRSVVPPSTSSLSSISISSTPTAVPPHPPARHFPSFKSMKQFLGLCPTLDK